MNGNLLQNLPDDCRDEIMESLLSSDNVRIERIISDGQSSPAGFWYDQAEHEFVLVMQGSATVGFEDGSLVDLSPGSWLHIPPHQKHRVLASSGETKTVWLAVFWSRT